MHRIKIGSYLIIIPLLVLSSCKEDLVSSFEFDQNNVKAPATITFTNTSVNATQYLWNFGDGETTTEANPVHEYKKGGEYDVSLKVYGEDDTHTSVQTVTILPNMTGHWNIIFVLGQNTMHARMNLEEMENQTLTGEFAMNDDTGYTPIESSSMIDGQDVTIDIQLFRFYKISFQGTANSTFDTMSGDFIFNGTPSGAWSGTKMQ